MRKKKTGTKGAHPSRKYPRREELYKRRMLYGNGVGVISRATGIHTVSYMRLEQARNNSPHKDQEPLSRKPWKSWRQNALRLADYYFCDPEDLFPEETARVEQSRRYAEAVGSENLIGDYSKQTATPVDARYEQIEIQNAVRSAMKRCTLKQRIILKVMSEFDRPTFEDAGKLCGGISMQAAQYAYDDAIYKMCSLPELAVFKSYAGFPQNILRNKREYRRMVTLAYKRTQGRRRIWRVP